MNNYELKQKQIARSVAVNNIYPKAEKWGKVEEAIADKIVEYIMKDTEPKEEVKDDKDRPPF